MLTYNIVDISKRKAHLEYFMSMQNPHVELTVDVDMSEVVLFCKNKKYPFFLMCLHIFALAAEAVPELRRRIHLLGQSLDNGKLEYEIREYENMPTSHTEIGSENSYCYCTVHHDMLLEEYIESARNAQIKARKSDSIEEDSDIEGYLFASCVPWLHYRSLSNPTNGPTDSNPRISWGKYDKDHQGRLMMPVTLTVHHGLVDGINMAQFFDNISREIAKLKGL